MAENTDHQPHPLTGALANLSPVEQLQVIMTHPFFTGRCPQCGYQFPLVHSISAGCDCPECGWADNLSNFPQESTISDRSLAANRTGVKRLGSYLVEAGLLSQAQVDTALAEQAARGMRLGEILAKLGWINQQTIEYLMKKIILPERATGQRKPFT